MLATFHLVELKYNTLLKIFNIEEIYKQHEDYVWRFYILKSLTKDAVVETRVLR